MCGICGIVTASRPGPDPDVLRKMADSIIHRGPDDEGIVVSGRAGIAARRLSIIDVHGGHQPIANEDETIWCALNGEIYNFPELMEQLRFRGHRFRTHCDTEVIVHLYEEYGLGFLDRIDGMFALVLWDARKDTVVLARDRIGIKPLYYADLGDRLLFGSELKALLPAGLPTDIDPDALNAYFTLTYVPTPFTIYRAARKLRPGHYLIWERGSAVREEPYWELPTSSGSAHPAGTQELAEELLRLLRLAVKRHMISDVPLGAFLSGGLDSSTVVALMAEQSSMPVSTFSIGFNERSYDETPHARVVAEAFGTDHHELVQQPDPLLLVEKLPWMYDEPFADSSAVATYSVAELARRHVTVALTGDGGDEVFGGYLIYRAHKLAQLYRGLPSVVRDGLVPWGTRLLPPSDRKISFEFKAKRFARDASLPPLQAHLGWRTNFPPDLRRQLLAEESGTDVALDLMQRYFALGLAGDAAGAALYADTRLGLPDDMLTKVDRATMAVSLEARVPLLDRAVVEFMASLPSSLKTHRLDLKYLLKRAVRDVVPRSVVQRKKEGFNVPVARWLRQDLRDLMLDVLSPTHVQEMGILDQTVVAEVIREHLDGTVDRGRELWLLLMFGLWHDRYLGHGAQDASLDLEGSERRLA